MEPTPLNVFVSYARDDDLQAIPGQGIGFISTLWAHLQHQFRLLGPPKPQMFRDTREIWESDPFDDILRARVAESNLLLVVLSNNWIHREWCLKELALFRESRANPAEQIVRQSIIVVAKNHVPPSSRPSLLQGQQGYSFYRLENEPGRPADEYSFWRGEPRDEFHDVLERLARDLRRRAVALSGVPPVEQPSVTPHRAATTSPRKIYVAKPAGDMHLHYLQMADELGRRGFEVVPPVDTEIPLRTATRSIETWLSTAETSIHLLGDGEGDKPEDTAPLVTLQLALAARRCAAAALSGTSFRRIIWAPKVLLDARAPAPPGERDPLAVLARFDRQIDSDKVDGSEITRFVEFVVQTLERQSLAADDDADLSRIPANASVYVYHRSDDREYGLRLARALKNLHLKPVLPTFEGEMVRPLHEQALQECDAVVLGWVNADDSWVKATTREWRDWQALGRKKQFDCRGLVAGPPKRDAKDDLIEFPPDEIDVVVDLSSGNAEFTPETLRALIRQGVTERDA